MDYKQFLKYTRAKNIHIYDAHARIIYSKLTNKLNNQIQIGGGNRSIKSIVKNLKPNTLTILLESVYANDTAIIKHIINNLI